MKQIKICSTVNVIIVIALALLIMSGCDNNEDDKIMMTQDEFDKKLLQEKYLHIIFDPSFCTKC